MEPNRIVINFFDIIRTQIRDECSYRRAYIGTKPLFKVKDHIVGGKFQAIIELNPPAHMKCPGFSVFIGSPILQ